jgi:CRISPR-associated protein Csd1
MLDQVVNYARQHGIDAEPGFSPKATRWAVICTARGEYLGLVELGDGSRKRNPGRLFSKAPDLSQPEMKSGGITKSHFLIDTANVVAGYGNDGADEKTLEKQAYFVELLEHASSAMPALGAIARMLRNEENLAKLRADLAKQNAMPTDKVTVQIDGAFPAESEELREWWREFRRALHTSRERKGHRDTKRMICFLTGETVEPATTHPKITGLTSVGGSAMGDVLVGFKQDSFCSYGLEQSANAAMSELGAKAYQTGLNDLIKNHSVMLSGTKVAHWFRKQVMTDDDPLNWMMEPGESEELNAQVRARNLLESIRHGERPDLANNSYFALTITSNRGRVMIRDWIEGSFHELMANVSDWFSDLEITHREGGRTAKTPKFLAVLAALVRDLKDVPPPIQTKLYRVAVRGEPMPLEVLAQALARARIDAIQGEPPTHARMGLIKAYHARKQRQDGARMEEQLKPELNARLKNPAYQCGRLMAVLGRLQTSALGDVGAGVVQRYYAAASTTPALVFGRLIRGAQFHLNKIAGQKRGLAVWYEQQIGEICNQIGTSMPATLNLEDQSLFALGYYQQLAVLRPGKEKNEREGEQDEQRD